MTTAKEKETQAQIAERNRAKAAGDGAEPQAADPDAIGGDGAAGQGFGSTGGQDKPSGAPAQEAAKPKAAAKPKKEPRPVLARTRATNRDFLPVATDSRAGVLAKKDLFAEITGASVQLAGGKAVVFVKPERGELTREKFEETGGAAAIADATMHVRLFVMDVRSHESHKTPHAHPKVVGMWCPVAGKVVQPKKDGAKTLHRGRMGKVFCKKDEEAVACQ